MSLVTTEAPDLITMRNSLAEIMVCPFTRNSEFNDYIDTKCKTGDCMAWVGVVDIHINYTNICPDGYEDITPEMFEALYGNRPQEYGKFYFQVKTDKKNVRGYCLRLKGCIQ